MSDGYSRYLLRCEALAHPDELACRKAFDKLFGEFGLPRVLRTDNGTPFSGRHGISSLSVWWVKLGIVPERIQRGKPTQNGRHERIHRTLKADALKSGKVASRMHLQQRAFDRFLHEYNTERPHEALDYKVPSAMYEPSSRRYPTKLRCPEYPDPWEVYKVRNDGSIKMSDRELFLSNVLRDEPVGLEPRDDGTLRVHYGPLHLGTISPRGRFTRGTRPRRTDSNDPSKQLTKDPDQAQSREML